MQSLVYAISFTFTLPLKSLWVLLPFNLLHCFSSLQLLEDRLDSHIRIEEYIQGRSLTLTYWRELSQHDPSSQLGYRLTVQADPTQPSKPLTVLHTPCLGSKVRQTKPVQEPEKSDTHFLLPCCMLCCINNLFVCKKLKANHIY